MSAARRDPSRENPARDPFDELEETSPNLAQELRAIARGYIAPLDSELENDMLARGVAVALRESAAMRIAEAARDAAHTAELASVREDLADALEGISDALRRNDATNLRLELVEREQLFWQKNFEELIRRSDLLKADDAAPEAASDEADGVDDGG